MSVLVLDPKCYEYINNGLTTAAFRTVCDHFYASPIRQYFQHKDLDKEGKRLILSWASLNEKSFNVKYKDTGHSLGQFIRFNANYQISAYQLLKYVHCLLYNIEPETIEDNEPLTDQEKQDLKLLKEWSKALEGAIINQIPEYKNAKWAEVA